MKKKVIIINGQGGSGKDTISTIVSKYYKVRHISSITPMKDMATLIGWNLEKDEKSRKFLSDLKKLCIEYNDYCVKYVLEEYNKFINSNDEILFIDIREPEEINKVVYNIKCITLLVKRGEYQVLGNKSDNEVNNYDYDYYYTNNFNSLIELEKDFIEWFKINILRHNS